MEYVVKDLQNEFGITGIVNLHFFEFQNNFSTQNERHPFYELVFINTGYLHVCSEDYTGDLTKSQMIIHRHNTVHSFICPRDCSPSVIIIGFLCDSAQIDMFSNRPITLNESSCKQLAEIIKEGRNVFAPPYNIPVHNMKKRKLQPYGAEQMLKVLLECFLIQLVRIHTSKEAVMDDLRSPLRISEVTAYINDNFCEKITIDELAFLFNTNRSTLCKEFKKATGKSIIEYINDKKFAYAKEKILTTDLTFTLICEKMKFETVHYFTRFFKKMSGMTPKEFRNRYKQATKED